MENNTCNNEIIATENKFSTPFFFFVLLWDYKFRALYFFGKNRYVYMIFKDTYVFKSIHTSIYTCIHTYLKASPVPSLPTCPQPLRNVIRFPSYHKAVAAYNGSSGPQSTTNSHLDKVLYEIYHVVVDPSALVDRTDSDRQDKGSKSSAICWSSNESRSDWLWW